jgi:5-(carboxyamino)imidazole ribonucleotide mutase
MAPFAAGPILTGKTTMTDTKPLVGILMGSKSDWEVMKNVTETLDMLGIPHEAKALSAHRNPEHVSEYATTARDRGIKVIVAGAGMAAALPGVVAALTPLPVLGVPMETRVMGGMDSLLSMAQMPGGIPVGTLAIGKAGAKNAALLAAAILALSDETIAATLDDFRQKQNDTIADLT